MSKFPTLLPKQKGELAEIHFAAEILRRGWRIARPYGDSCRYDCIVDCGGHLSRVQVKGVESRNGGKRDPYAVKMVHGRYNHLVYSSREVDVIAVLVIPKSMWYIVPLSAVDGRRQIAFGGSEESTGALEKYREAWNQFLGGRR